MHEQLFIKGAHSGYVDMIYTFGIVGCLIVTFLIFAYSTQVKNKKERFTIANFIPLFLLLILALEESIFFSINLSILFIMSFLFLFDKKEFKMEISTEMKINLKNHKKNNKLKFAKLKDIFSGLKLLLVFVPALITKIFIRDFWLVCEDEMEARDNGYFFFKYVRQKYPKQKIAYAINKRSVDFFKVKNVGKIISFGSLAHWFWYIVADKNISSQKGGKPNAAVCYFFEVILKFRKKNRIFLQHGIIINDTNFLHFNNSNIAKFMTSTYQEFNFILNKFNYPKGHVFLTGLCRFDNLFNYNANKNQILVMPTWRQWISKEVEMNEIENTKEFTKTEYFKYWYNFLNSKELEVILKKNNKKLIFYPHRNMQKYLNYFNVKKENIVIADFKNYDVQELLKDSALLITDYSSVFFDFAYMKKPIIFFQFDEDKFRNYQYKEGYFDYKNNGFSLWAKTEKDLLKKINEVIDNEMELKDKSQVDKYFPFRDTNNCERNYQVIKNDKNYPQQFKN